MKHIVTILALVALVNFTIAPYSVAGEVKRQPLQMQEMVELKIEEANDFDIVEETEAGIQNGYGIFALALAVAVGYVVSEQINDDDED